LAIYLLQIDGAQLIKSETQTVSLLAQASTMKAGLIVMGAYTHGHYHSFYLVE
jgi:hypothetical protein